MNESRIVLWRSLGGAICIVAMFFFSGMSELPLMLIPFATSIVLVFGLPDVEPAQPRALVGGHVVCTLAGLAFSYAFGPSPWIAAFAVGAAMVAMHYSRTMHPPAGIDPLIIVNEHLPWTFFFIPVLAGSVLLACFAFLWLNAFEKRTWPKRWT